MDFDIIYFPDEIILKIIKNTPKKQIHKWRQISKKHKLMVDSYTLNYPYKLYKKYKYYCTNIDDYLNNKDPYYFLVFVYYTYSICYHKQIYNYAIKNNHAGLIKLMKHIYNNNNLEELFERRNRLTPINIILKFALNNK